MKRIVMLLAASTCLPAQTNTVAVAQQAGMVAAPTLSAGPRAPVVAGKPFSAVEVRHTVQTLSDGTPVDKTESHPYYRDDYGRTRTETNDNVTINDPVGGFMYILMPANKTYLKIQRMGGGGAGGRGGMVSATGTKKGDDRVVEDLAQQSINGVGAHGSRTTRTIPAGTFGNLRDVKVVEERWFSDDLQLLVKSTNSDPRFGTTTYELTNIVRSQPDPALFQPPADYTKREGAAAGGFGGGR